MLFAQICRKNLKLRTIEEVGFLGGKWLSSWCEIVWPVLIDEQMSKKMAIFPTKSRANEQLGGG